MIYINHNHTLKQLRSLVSIKQQNLNYMSNEFNKEQYNAIELLKQRVYLEEVVEECVKFNRELNFDTGDNNLHIIRSAEELVNIFKLRSEVYTQLGYQNEFPSIIDGLNFDIYDTSSAIIYYGTKKYASGSVRLIFDSKNKLPIEEKFSLNTLRDQHNLIGEFSRLVAHNKTKGLSLEFKYLMGGIYNIVINNNVDIIMSAIKEEHFKLYSKFGREIILSRHLPICYIQCTCNPSQNNCN